METTFLQDGAHIHLSVVHEDVLPSGFSGTRHRHGFHEIGLVLEGECTWHFRRGAREVLRRGDAVVIPEGEWHREAARGPVQLAWCGFSGIRNASQLPIRARIPLGGDLGAVEWLLREIYREQAKARPASPRLVRLALEQVLVLLSSVAASSNARVRKARRTIPESRQRMVRSIAAHFAQNPERPLSLIEIARYHRISPRHLSLLFRRVVGTKPAEFRQQQRLERAKALLRAGGASIKETAAACGFADAAHFCKAFRASTGRSPGEWRAEN